MNVLLVDDEELALEVLERMLMKLEDIQICGKYVDAEQALKRLECDDIDVVFLDLEMGGMHGLRFSEELLNMDIATEIVFVTAHSQYAVDAFGFGAVDYLLKPVAMDRLLKTVKKLKDRQELKKLKESHDGHQPSCLLLRSFGTLRVYETDEEAALPIKWRTKKVKELFCYLWQNSARPAGKYQIMEELWPETEPDKGGTLLHTTVYQLRKALKELGFENGIQFRNEQYQLAVPIKSDLEELQRLLEESDPLTKDIKRLLELYEGDYLEQEEYLWSIHVQQALRNTYLKCLKKYVDRNMGRKSRNTLLESCLQKLVHLDPYNEEYARMLMSYYSGEGNAREAVKVYERYYRSVKEELGLNPSRKIVELYGELIKNK
ncbi:MAG TPA: response regulator [Clostridiales bacterium]|nr:response regulator [Clostridiales bacterium]